MDLIVIYSGEFGERVIGNLINYSTFCISCAEVCTHYKEDKYCLLELLPVSKDFRIEAIDMAVTIFYPDNALLPGSPGTCILYNVTMTWLNIHTAGASLELPPIHRYGHDHILC